MFGAFLFALDRALIVYDFLKKESQFKYISIFRKLPQTYSFAK